MFSPQAMQVQKGLESKNQYKFRFNKLLIKRDKINNSNYLLIATTTKKNIL